jgi:hypothetical protein
MATIGAKPLAWTRPSAQGRRPTASQAPSSPPSWARPKRRARLHDLPATTSGAKLYSTNPIERLNGEIKRRTDVVGTPAEDAIVRLVGAILLQQNDEWAVQRARYMTPETIAPLSDDPTVNLPAIAVPFPALAGDRGAPPPVTPRLGTRSAAVGQA